MLAFLGRVPILLVLYKHRPATAHCPSANYQMHTQGEHSELRPSAVIIGLLLYLRVAASPAGPRLSYQECDSGEANQASISKTVRENPCLCIPDLQVLMTHHKHVERHVLSKPMPAEQGLL